jgi:hypothetical protein
MLYHITISGDLITAYNKDKRGGVFDTETFLTHVISPKEFKSFERNPNKREFEIRKIEFELYKIKSNDSHY